MTMPLSHRGQLGGSKRIAMSLVSSRCELSSLIQSHMLLFRWVFCSAFGAFTSWSNFSFALPCLAALFGLSGTITSTTRHSTTILSTGLSFLHRSLGQGKLRDFFAGGTGKSRILLILKIIYIVELGWFLVVAMHRPLNPKMSQCYLLLFLWCNIWHFPTIKCIVLTLTLLWVFIQCT